MSEGGTQYDLKLGLDTGPAKPGVQSLAADLVKTGESADRVQDKLTAASAASGKMGASAKAAGASAASAATSNDKLATSAARSDAAVTKTSGSLGKMAASATSAEGAASKTARASDALSASSTKTAATTERLGTSATRLAASLGTEARQASAASASTDQLAASSARANTSLSTLWRTLIGVVGVTVSLQAGIAGFRTVVDNFTGYEAALIGVSKTTGIAGRDLKDFYGNILDLSTSTVPLATKDLLAIGQAAGSLGVTGKENIERYAESIGKLSAASEDLKGDEAATLLTRMMNVQGEGPENVERLANVIVRLGLNSTATERQIARAGQEVSLATAQFRIGTTAAAAYGAAIAESMGDRVELGGSAIGRVMREIQAAVATGGKALTNFATVAGQTADQFKTSWETNKTKAFDDFLKGLATYGPSAGVVLERLGLGGDEIAKIIPNLAINFERFAETERLAADEAVRMTALNEKSGMVFASTGSELQRLQNAYEGVQKIVGEGMAPALREVSAELRVFAEESENGAQRLGEAMGTALKQVVALLIILGKHLDLVKVALEAWLAVRALVFIQALAAGLVGLIAKLTAYTAVKTSATLAERAHAIAIATFAQTVVTTSPIVDAYGAAIVRTKVSTDAAAVSSSRFLTGGITPLTIGLGILLGALLLVNDKLVQFSRNAQAEIEAMVTATNNLGAAVAKIRKDTSDLISEERFQQRLADELRAEGLKAGSPEAIERETRLRADQQRQMVAGWREQKTALDEHRQSLTNYKSQLDAAVQAESKLRFKTQEEEDRARAVAMGPGRGSRETADLADRVQKLDAARGQIQKLQLSANDARVRVGELTKSTATLTEATEGYVPPAEQANRSLGDLAGKADKAGQKFGNLTAQIEAATRSNNLIAAAYGKSSEEGRKAEQEAELLSRQLQAASGVEDQYKASIEGRVEAQVRSERGAVGAKTIAALTDQIAAAEKLAAAYDSGLQPAIEEARREQDLLQQRLVNASGAADEQVDTIGDLTGRLAELNQSNAFASQTDQIKESNRVLGDAAERWDGTSISIEQTNIALQVHNQIAQSTIGRTADEAAALGRLIREHERLSAVMEARLRLGRLEEETRRTRELAAIKRDDYLTEREYQRALATVNTEHEVRSALISLEANKYQALINLKREDFKLEEDYKAARAAIETQFDDYAKRTEAAIREQAALNRETAEYISLVRIVATAGNAAFQAVKDSIRDALTQAIQEGSVNWESIWDSLTDRLLGIFLDMLEEMLTRWIATQAAMAATSVALGSTQTNGAAGVGLNFAPAATSGGGGLTGLWGGAGTAGVAGSGSGAAGLFSGTGAAGAAGMVGAWVAVLVLFAIAVNKLNDAMKGTKEYVILLDESLNVTIPNSGTAGGGRLDNLVSHGNALAEEIQQFFFAFGGIFQSLDAEIGIKRRGQGKKTEWKVYVDGVVKNFGRDQEAAMNYALIQAIKHSSSVGLDPLVVAAIKNYMGESIDEFKAQIEFAQRIATQNLPGISGQVSSAASQYFADLHQAQVVFKDDAAALDTAIESITRKFSETVQALKNSALGVDTSTADFLASLVAFNEQMAKGAEVAGQQTRERIAAAQAELDAMGAGPRISRDADVEDRERSQADWEAARARLREQIARYTAELDKIPQALSDQELSMAIFDSLYKYLEGDEKYAEQAHKYAILRVELEFAAIQAQLVALGRWEEFAGMWQDALNAARETAGKPAGRGGGRGGGATKEDRADFLEELDVIARGTLPESVQQVLALSDQLDEMSERAKELKVSEERLAAARQVLIDQQKRDILDPVREFLTPQEGGTFGLSQWDTAEAEIRQKFADARAANQALIAETGQRAIAFWRLNQAEIRALQKLAEDAIDSLGLPLEGIRDKVDALKTTLSYLAESVVAGTLSAERFDQVIRELGQQAQVEVLNLMDSILDQMGATQQSEDVKRQLAEATFVMEVAQINFLYGQYVALGLIAGETKDRMDVLLGFINDPKNWPDFKKRPPGAEEGPRFKGYGDESSSASSAGSDWQQVLDDVLAQLREWRDSALGAMQRDARDLKARRDQLLAEMARAGGRGRGVDLVSELNAAYAVQVDQFVEEALAGFDRLPEVVAAARELRDQLADVEAAFSDLGVSTEDAARAERAHQQAVEGFVDDSLRDYERLGRNPLTLELEDITDRFNDLQTAFETIGASADQMARLEQSRILALEDWWKRATEGIQNLIKELRGQDPRVSSQVRFLDARQEFRDVLARAQGGDLEAVQQLQEAASLYREQTRAFLGGGVGSQAALDEILTGLERIVGMEPALDPVIGSLAETNDLLAQIRDGLKAWLPAAGGAAGSADRSGDNNAASSSRSRSRGRVESDSSSSGPSILTLTGGDGGGGATSPELIAFLRSIEEREKKKGEEGRRREQKRTVQEATEVEQREEMLIRLSAIVDAIDGLRKDLKDQRPPAGS